MLMSVPSTLMVVLKFVRTPLDPIHAVEGLGIDCLPMDDLVKVAITLKLPIICLSYWIQLELFQMLMSVPSTLMAVLTTAPTL